MCGLCGVCGPGARSSFAGIERATELLACRGPDATGIWQSPSAVLGHTRLSIIDLDERSNQPFFDPTGRFALVYNGEVYNYRELRAGLPHWHFRTESDTEVVLAALCHWGTDAFAKFNGMWALAWLDLQENSLVLSRDPFGIKPLYYVVEADTIRFASSVNAIATSMKSSLTPDLEQLARYLVTGLGNHLDATFYNEVREVMPAEFIIWHESRARRHRYWTFPTAGYDKPDPDELEHLLRDAVRLRLRSDVPVGMTLSGGLDSSLIAQFAADEGLHLRAFTATFVGDFTPDESATAQATSKALDHSWNPVNLDRQSGSLTRLTEICDAMDGPNSSPAALALWCISRSASEHGCPVLLEGQGADEVFGGYPTILGPFWLRSLLRSGRVTEFPNAAKGMIRQLGVAGTTKHTVRRVVPGAHWLYTRSLGLRGALRGPLEEASRPDLGDTHWRMSAHEALEHTLVTGLRDLLQYGDRMSMAHSIETRQPFLDTRLVDFALRSDLSQRLGSGLGKDALREVAHRCLRYQQPIHNRKAGFVIPTSVWLNADSRNAVISGELVARGMLDRGRVTSILDRARTSASTMARQQAYRLLTAEIWWRTRFSGR